MSATRAERCTAQMISIFRAMLKLWRANTCQVRLGEDLTVSRLLHASNILLGSHMLPVLVEFDGAPASNDL